LKNEALEITEVGGPFETKVLMQYSCFGPMWKQDIYTLQLLLVASLQEGTFHITVATKGCPLKA